MYSPPVSACTSTDDWSWFGGARSGGMERVLRRPFRARLRGGRFLGLKPQAESYSPFGAPEPRSNPENQRVKAQNATNSILLSQLAARSFKRMGGFISRVAKQSTIGQSPQNYLLFQGQDSRDGSVAEA